MIKQQIKLDGVVFTVQASIELADPDCGLMNDELIIESVKVGDVEIGDCIKDCIIHKLEKKIIENLESKK